MARINKSPAHLVRRPSGYHWRMKVPPKLRDTVGRGELRRALGTSDLSEARRTSAILTGTAHHALAMADHLTDSELQALLRTKLDAALQDAEQARLLRRPLSGEALEDHTDALSFLLSDTREALATGDYRGVRNEVSEWMKEAGLAVEYDSLEYRRLCREYLKMRAQYLEIESQRALGRYESTVSVTSSVAPSAAPSAPSGSGLSLSKAVTKYTEEHTRPGQSRWTEKTRAENEAVYDLMARVLGDRPMAEINRQVINEYRDKLMRLPANLNKSKEYRGKTIAEVLAMKPAPMATNTINKNLVRAASLFKWAYQHGHIPLNPAEALTLPKAKRADEEREVFTTEELRRIFEPREYKHQYQRWIPLIALYTGARLEEISQARVDDVREADGVMVLHICPGEGKKLKTKSANRMVPLHSALVGAGLLDYVEQRRAAGDARLFPELERGRDGYGQTVSKWFSRLRKQLGLGGVFHSFRHTVATKLKEEDVPEHAIAQILGHEHGQISTGRYGKRHEPKKLQRWVELLDFSIS